MQGARFGVGGLCRFLVGGFGGWVDWFGLVWFWACCGLMFWVSGLLWFLCLAWAGEVLLDCGL